MSIVHVANHLDDKLTQFYRRLPNAAEQLHRFAIREAADPGSKRGNGGHGRDGDGLTFSDLPHVQDIAKMKASPFQPRNRKSTD